MSKRYDEEANSLVKAIDIAIEAFKTYPPKQLNANQIDLIVNGYLEIRDKTLYGDVEFKNLQSLKYKINDVIDFFQETNGTIVEYFWTEIVKNNLPYKRENKLLKILNRKKIKNDMEYNFTVDVIGPYVEQGLINSEQEILLKKSIGEFENRKPR